MPAVHAPRRSRRVARSPGSAPGMMRTQGFHCLRCSAAASRAGSASFSQIKAEDPRLLVELLGHLHRLDHAGHGVDRVLGEVDDPLGAGAHADAAAAAAQRVELRRALLVLVERAEGTLLGAALALGAALQEEVGHRDVAGARVHRLAADRPRRCTASPSSPRPSRPRRRGRLHRSAQRAGGVDARAPGLVGEADEVRVGEARTRAPAGPAPGGSPGSGSRCRRGALFSSTSFSASSRCLSESVVSDALRGVRRRCGSPRRRPQLGTMPTASTTRSAGSTTSSPSRLFLTSTGQRAVAVGRRPPPRRRGSGRSSGAPGPPGRSARSGPACACRGRRPWSRPRAPARGSSATCFSVVRQHSAEQ